MEAYDCVIFPEKDGCSAQSKYKLVEFSFKYIHKFHDEKQLL